MNFLNRLFASFGIWYYFDHSRVQEDEDGPVVERKLADPSFSEQLVLGRGAALINIFDGFYNGNTTLEIRGGKALEGTVAKFGISYHSVPQTTLVGDFNQLSPTAPIRGHSPINPLYGTDPFSGADGGGSAPAASANSAEPGGSTVSSRLSSAYFPAESFLWHAAGPLGDVSADADAVTRMEQAESTIFTVHGQTRNANLVVGRKIYLHDRSDVNDSAVRVNNRTYLLSAQSIYSYESSYGRHAWSDIWNLLTDLFVTPFESDSGDVDMATAVAANGLNNYLKQKFYYEFTGGTSIYSSTTPGMPNSFQVTAKDPSFNYFASGAFASITSAAALAVGAIRNIFKNHSDDFSSSFTAIVFPDNQAAVLPLPAATKPVAGGPHLAVVIGDDGVDAEKGDISVDALGRVRIRFPWDQSPPPTDQAAGDADAEPQFTHGSNTCWVRVSEAWAGHASGALHGSQFLPRIGDEVLVDFIAGDPERPMIVGRVYNAAAKPPFPTATAAGFTASSDYLLNPSTGPGYGANTRSGIRTRNTFKPKGKPEGYHLLRFEDYYDSPQVLLRSQGRYDLTAFCSYFETTYANRYIKVVPTPKSARNPGHGGNSFTTIGGECDIHVGASRYEQVEKDENLTVKGDTVFDLKGNFAGMVGNNLTLNAGTVTIEASKKISLKVGGSSVVITPCGVYIDGCMVYVNCGGSPDSAADQKVSAPVDAKTADDGSTDTRAADDCGGGGGGGRGGGGGGSRAQSVPAQHAPPVANCGDTFCVDPAGQGVSAP